MRGQRRDLRNKALSLNIEEERDASGSRPTGRRHPPAAAERHLARSGSGRADTGLSDAREVADPSPVSVGISVVIPARNEADNIAWVLQRIPAFVDEVVIVDGQSTDDTIEVARLVRPDVVVVSDNGVGKGDAMRVGGMAARGSIIVMIDADGSMDPAEIERYVEPLAQKFDVVKGSRFLPGAGTSDMTNLRKVGHLGLLTLANVLYGSKWTDLCYGFCAFRRSAFEELALDADGFEIETQIVVRATRMGMRIAEVPSFEYPRRSGNSQLNTFRDGFRVLGTIFDERIRRLAPRAADEPGLADELTDA
jgi:glycosyltransferase involved in cell wall biosynthesis